MVCLRYNRPRHSLNAVNVRACNFTTPMLGCSWGVGMVWVIQVIVILRECPSQTLAVAFWRWSSMDELQRLAPPGRNLSETDQHSVLLTGPKRR